MSTNYPGALDALTNPTATATLDSATVPHAAQHANANDAIEAIEATLGVNPQGGSATVVARLNTLDTTVAGKETPAGAQAKADAAQAAAVATAAADATSKASTAQSNATSTAAADATSKVATHAAVTTNVHGIANTANLVVTSDSRLSDTRTPTDGSVTTAKIADSAVTSAKIADGTIVNADISTTAAIAPSKIDGTAVITTDSRLSDARTPTDGSVTTVKIADGAVTSAKIADGTIATADLANAAVTNAKIADSTIANAKLVNSAIIVNGTSISLGGSGTVSAALTGAAGGDLTGNYPNPQILAGAVTIAQTRAPVLSTSGGVGAVFLVDNPALTRGAVVSGKATWVITHNFGRNPVMVNLMTYASGAPISPSGLTISQGDTAGADTSNKVTVSWTVSANVNANSYRAIVIG